MRKLKKLLACLPRVRFSLRRSNHSSTDITTSRAQPCLPSDRREAASQPVAWQRLLLRVFEEAAKVGMNRSDDRSFVFEIPQSLIPRKYPALFALALAEGGYEAGLVPLRVEVRVQNRKREGRLIVKKVAH